MENALLSYSNYRNNAEHFFSSYPSPHYVINSSVDNSTRLNSRIIKNSVHTSFELFKCLTGYSNADLGMVGRRVGLGHISLDNGGETEMLTQALCCRMCCKSKGAKREFSCQCQ